jgi:putative ABC transport system permease protein
VLTTAACTADLSVALAGQARHAAPGPLGSAATTTLNVLAALAVVAACAVAALAVRLGAAARRAADERLVTMGLTTRQARAISLAENAPPALGGALTGALATVPLLQIIGPALGGSAIPASATSLILPALAVALPAAAAGVAGNGTLTRTRTGEAQ